MANTDRPLRTAVKRRCQARFDFVLLLSGEEVARAVVVGVHASHVVSEFGISRSVLAEIR
jgi:hypothetical protein